MKKWPNLTGGFSIIEILVSVGLLAVLIPVLFAGFIAIQDGKPQQEQRTRAILMLNESVEALRVIREQGWDNVATNGTYHPVQTATSWALQSGPETLDGITRSIVISDGYRTAAGVLTTSGTTDLSTKSVTITVSWNQPLTSSLSNTFYLTRYLDSMTYVYTTYADFTASGYTSSLLDIVNTNGGQIILSPSGPGKGSWCTPSSVATLDLPKSGAARAISAREGAVTAGTGLNASGVSLAHVSVTQASPPVVSLQGTFDGYKTNDVFTVPSYDYIATDSNSKEILIVNSSTMTESGYFNLPGSANASRIFVANNVGYASDGSTLYLFDASSGTGSRTQLGSIALPATINGLYVVGNYAYVSIASTTGQLKIVDVTNSAAPSIVGTLTVNAGNGAGVTVNDAGTRTYLITASSATQAEMFIINTTTKNSPSLISSYDTNGMSPQGVAVVLSGNRVVVVGTSGEEYQVVSTAVESSPSRCGGLEENTGIYDIAAVLEADTDAYAYVTTGLASSELLVVEGGPGGTYSYNGEYVSPAFDAGDTTAFNRISMTATQPTDTQIRLQVAGADAVSGSCTGATYSFVGPDGTSSTYFTSTNNGLPFNNDGTGYENPAQCFKYKAYFSTTVGTVTPTLHDVTFNYSP